MASEACDHTNVEFIAYIAAPGYGKSYKCADCGEPMWGTTKDDAVPYSELDGPPELSLEDII